MNLSDIKDKIPKPLFEALSLKGIADLRPSQHKAINAGLLKGKNLLVCTPTASGKTLIAELAAVKAILEKRGKAVYIVPLRSLATEKFHEFKEKYGELMKVALSIGEIDSADPHLAEYDLIVLTAEKLDSLMRHRAPWIKLLSVVVIDEVHMLNDPGRGPTLEILITLLKQLIPQAQIVALSATIGNPQELAQWLESELVLDNWRPVKLHKGVYFNGKVEFE